MSNSNIFNLFLLCMLMTSCLGDETSEKDIIQFTSDDLSYLYLNLDTLSFDGNPIQHEDTVMFLYNGVETISTIAKTKIVPNYDIFSPTGVSPGISGESTLIFSDIKEFRYLSVCVTRENYTMYLGTNYSNYVLFDVGLYEYYSFSKRIFLSDPVNLDSVSILGVHYDDVLNLTPDSSSQSRFRKILFAKKFGFIKIETSNGNKLERL